MKKIYSPEAPERVVLMGAKKQLNYNIHEVEEDEIKALWEKSENTGMPYDDFAEQHKWGYYSLAVGGARWSYEGIVNAIIREKYPESDMEAITNNMNMIVGEFFNVLVTNGIVDAIKYLVSSKDEDNTIAFREMQEWRAKAKAWARDVFKK